MPRSGKTASETIDYSTDRVRGPSSVILAEARIHGFPENGLEWIPAFAGMTTLRRGIRLEIAGAAELDDVAGRVIAAGCFALEVRDEGDEHLAELGFVGGFGCGDEAFDPAHEALRNAGLFRPEQLGVVGGEGVFFVEEHLFVELFAGTDAGELELDVLAGFETAKPDEIGCEVYDLDGFAHIKDEDFAAESEGARLEDKLDRLGDGHEVAAHLRMSDQHGPASAYLTEERGHD